AVWTVHDGPGISRFDRKTRRWQVIRIGVAARTGAPQTILTGRALAVERHYNVWIGGAGDLGLFWYGATSRKARRVLRMPGREVVAVTVGHGAVWALFRRTPGSKEPSVLVRIGSDRSAQHQRERNQEATRRAYQELALSHTGSNPPTVVAAVRAARTWLIRHQERDGRFDADGFARHDPAGQRCDGAGRPGNDACTTALAVLAMLPRSPSDDTEPAVRRGIDAAAQWLIRQQVRTSGHIRGGTGRTAPFGHAVATLALLRTYAAFGNARIRSAAELAVRDLQRTQLDGQGWRFGANDRHSDPSVTAWAIEALVTAAELGFSIDTKRLGAALAFLDETTFGGTLRSGRTAAEPVAALYARTLLGQRQSNTAAVRSAFESLRTNEVRWSPGDVDLLAWYFGSHATSRLDGSEQAQQKYHRVLLDAQCTQGSAAGSWDPIGTWGEQGGRSFATALGTLVLNASRHIANSHPGGQLSGDPRLDSLRTLDEPTYAALARALRGLGSKFQAKSMKDALVIRQLQRTWSIAIAAAGRILAQVERGDPMRIAGRTRQLAEDFAGLPQGETARAAVERWRRDPVLRRELDAAQRLTELRAKHRDSATPAYLDAVEEFVGRNLEARCAAPLVDELLSRNTVRGTARRPAGARVLEAPRPRADQVALVLGDAPEQRAALTIPARWWQDPTAPGLAFVDPEDPQERLRISVHRGKTSPEVAKRMPSPSSTELATTATGNTVRTSAIRAGNRRLPCQMWTFRTPTDPKSVRRVALLEVQGSVVELELVSRRGAAELTRILASIRTGARYATQDSFQARIGGWLLQGSLPDLAPASAEGGELVWHERDRSGKHIATFRLHAAAANSASLVAHATSARARLAGGTAVWQAQLRRSPRDPHWLIYSHQDGGTQQAMAITRIEGTLDLMVTYRGPDSSLTKLQRVVAALRGKPVPESR
ncbi:MAG: terpene cyclase/mutase family protein, partial [Planctomycetes bacterium]|nr:terpene cyclase/mutase family protein [Planctomycetota bacterium]